MYHAAAVLYPQAMATSVSLPMEILHAASQTASVAHRGQPQVEFKLLGPNQRMLRLASGIALKPDLALDKKPPLDLLVLPAIWRNPLPAVAANRAILAQLRDYAASGTRICSVGSGSFLLAEAGLLDGKPATTHWNYLDAFRQRYPSVELKSRHLITQADNIYCVGSVNSIADLMVHIIEEWFGSRVARAVENQFSPEIRRSFSAAAYQNEADSSHHDELVAEAQQWLQNHHAEPGSLAALAERLEVSQRTLGRRFQRATGMSPQAYLQSLRLTGAKDLLRHSNLSVGEIAWQLGIADVSYFSQMFRQHAGMSPLKYRQAVRGKLFSPGASS